MIKRKANITRNQIKDEIVESIDPKKMELMNIV